MYTRTQRKVQDMLDRLVYEEKLCANQEIFTSIEQALRMRWLHCLRPTHGAAMRTTTIHTLRRICSGIVAVDEPEAAL